MVTRIAAAAAAFALIAPRATAAEEAPRANAFYERTSFVLPPDVKFEASGLAVLPDGRAAIALRKGEVWLLENPTGDPARAQFSRFASGLHEPLGLTWHEGALYTTQRSEVTRLEDRDGNGVADLYSTAAKGWGVSGNYHEYAYGPVFDREGNLWVTLNVTIGTKPPLGGNRMGDPLWRGWAMRQAPGGKLEPAAAGFRSPFGLGLNAEGDVFATDQQGNWWGTCPLLHLRVGRFYGHAESIPDTRRPDSPVRDPGVLPQNATVVEAARQVPGFAPPAVWFPYAKMGQSATGLICDRTLGGFGPFGGQLFVGDFTMAQVNRVYLEKINGEYQGACFPFLDGFQSAVLQMAFLPDGSMLVGESNRGWNSLGSRSYGLERVRWTGRTPFAVLRMEAQPDGFRLTFTEPVAARDSLATGPFKMISYTYHYHAKYGSEEVDVRSLQVTSAETDPTGLTVSLKCAGLRPGYIHELQLPDLRSASGQKLSHERAYYTLNQIPSSR